VPRQLTKGEFYEFSIEMAKAVVGVDVRCRRWCSDDGGDAFSLRSNRLRFQDAMRGRVALPGRLPVL
jgi:hypothetical protein